MILVDTSVWIEFLRKREPYFGHLLELLEHREVLTIEPIFGELLQGAKGVYEIKLLEDFFKNLPKPELGELLLRAGSLSSKRQLFSKGLGLIDASLLLTSLKTKTPLWTLDKKLKNETPKSLHYEPKF